MYILVGSITIATRLKKQLEAASGYPAEVVHTPKKLNETGGCSYSVRADNRLIPFVRSICNEHGIKIKDIYTEEISNGERVFNVVS